MERDKDICDACGKNFRDKNIDFDLSKSKTISETLFLGPIDYPLRNGKIIEIICAKCLEERKIPGGVKPK